MPEKMPTIAEFARTLGVSKSNVVNKIKELELETVTKPGDRRRCQYLPEGTCSVLADKLAKTKPAVQADETRLLDLYQAQVEPLSQPTTACKGRSSCSWTSSPPPRGPPRNLPDSPRLVSTI